MDRIRVGLIGCGMWGRNIAREIAASREARLAVVADPDPAAREAARALARDARTVADIGDALAEPLDAVVVASPPERHAEHARAALDAGLHVLVEKPLATTVSDAVDLAHRAERLPGRVAMVGHLMRYHPAVEELERLVSTGSIGRPLYALAARLSVSPPAPPSPPSTGDSIVWALGPHDLSIAVALAGTPTRTTISGGIEDESTLHATFSGGLILDAYLSRNHPRKERIFVAAAEETTVLFDDVRAPRRLLLLPGHPIAKTTTREVLMRAAIARQPGAQLVTEVVPNPGPSRVVELPDQAPLRRELDHFWACIRGRNAPKTPFSEGLTIVRALAEAVRPSLTEPARATISTA